MKVFLQKTFLSLTLALFFSIGFGQIPAGYYNNAVGKTGDVLRSALCTITTTGHVKLPYTSTAFDVWDAYAKTDVTVPGGTTIYDMYSRKCDGTANYYFVLYTKQCGTSGAEGDCYSREHCLPNSCWGGLDNAANPQYTDLHHLFPCDQYVNVQKSNNMIGETNAPTYTSSNGSKTGPCSYPGYTDKVFEPLDCYKGDFARAWLYLATRYMITMPSWTPSSGSAAMWPLLYNSSTNNYQPWVINMLLDWCALDPVDQWEIDRNDNIYYNTPQHNRNPYIDHPEYVCLVWGTSCVSAPTITNVLNSPANPTSTDVVNVSASITDDGSVSNAILYWDVTPGTFSNSIGMSVGTPPTYTTSSTIPAQVAGTTVYYKIVATDNEAHPTTSDIYTYNVPQAEPDNHPTNFTCGTTTSSSIPLTWTDAIGTILPNGYLIKMSSVSLADITNPSDGTPVADGSTAKNILPGVQTCTFTGLTSSTTYYFKIYSYSNSGSNINYKLIGTVQSTSCATIAGGGGIAACVAEAFDLGATAPTNWIFTGITNTYTTSGNYGAASPSISFNTDLDQVITPIVSNPTELKFWIKGQSVSGGTSLLVEGYNGSTWSTIENITLTGTGLTKTYNSSSTPSLAPGFTQFRFTLNKVTGNLAFDDVSVTCETGCSSPATQASVMTFNTITSNSMIAAWTRGSGNNVLVLAKAGSAVNADPVSGTVYIDSDVFGSGDQLGTGNYVVYNGPASSVQVTGLSASTTYYFAVYEYNNTEICYKTPGLTGNQATSTPVIIPTLTTNTPSSISITTATCGGDITADGGSGVTARGVCWNTATGPTIANSKTTDGTGTGSFTSSMTGLTAGTIYYVRAYATNVNGTAYGDEQVFATLRAEPSNYPTNFTCGTTTTTTIPLTWTGATGTVLPHSYLIKASPVGYSSIADPVDGTPEADAALVKNVVYGTNSFTFTGLNSNTTYYFKIYSYTNSSTSINYKTDATVPSTSCTTVAIPVTIVYQGFESSPQDTWNYAGGNANSSTYKYVGTYSREIATGQTVTFNNISLASYSSVNLAVAFSALNLAKTENLYLDISYDNGSTWTGTGSVTLVNCNQTSGTRSVAFGATSSNKPTTVATNPWVVSIPGTSAQIAIRLRCGTLSGTYYIDDIKLSGIQSCTYPTAYNVTGGGSFCSGGSGVTIGLDGSATGINYQLMLGVSPIGSPVAGTGSAISFGLQTTGGTYYVTGTNATTSCATNMNGTATVTVNPALAASVSIAANPGTTVCPSTSVTFTATVTNGGAAPTYQWKKNGSNVGSATNSTYTNTPVNGDYYTCVITSNLACVTGSPATSNTLTMSISSPAASVNIAANPSGAICDGTSVTFTATPTNGGATPSYQWKDNGSSISGATNSTYTSTTLLNGHAITCVMTSSLSCATGSPATSNTVTMIVNATSAVSVSIAAVPSGSIAAGTSVTFTATPTNGGSTPAYQWKVNGSNMGTNSSTYTTTALANGDVITCVLTSNISCPSGSPATSNSIAMTVTASCSGGTTTVFSDDFNRASFSPGGTPSMTYTTTVTAGDGGASINSSTFLELTNDASGTANASGIVYTTGPLSTYSSPFTGILSSNAGLVTWTFNLRFNRASSNNPANPASGAYGEAIVLAGSSSTLTSGTGYAIVYGNSLTPDPIRLVSYSAGVGTNTNIISSGVSDIANTNNYASVKVTYNPTGNLWTLYLRDDGVSAWSDPSSGVTTQIGSSTANSTYTGTSLGSFGFLWSYATAASQTSQFDNFKVTVGSGGSGYPATYTVSGGGTLCSGGSGVTVNLSGSESGVNYQLKVDGGNTGSPIAGTGSAISFTNVTSAGTCTIVGTNSTSGCQTTMTGSANVTVNSLPAAYAMTGASSYCNGGSGTALGLNGSESGVNYQLKIDGGNTGSPVAGTGSAITFGNQTTTGTYTVVATNATTTCTNTMTGSIAVSINPLPTAYNVTGGGVYCSGGTGVAVGLDGSQSGVNYQLKIGGVNTGSPVAGTGAAISIGNQTTAGTCTVEATNVTTSCVRTMTGSVSITTNALPTTYNVTGGGALCNGGSAVPIGLSGSQTNVNYQLQLNSSPWGSPVAGTGSALSFGTFSLGGTYTVVATHATTGCVSTMTGNAIVTVNPNPTPYSVTGGGSYCSGGSGVAVGLSNSESGVNYQLKIGGSNTGGTVAGTGAAISFGNHTAAGTYTVSASNATTGCTNSMTGNVTVIINALPAAYSVTGGGTYCSGGSGVTVGLANSETGVNYQLQIGAVNTGSPIAGTGSAISFGLKTAAGTYTVVATNASTSCTSNMTGSVAVTINTIQPVASVSNTPGCGIGDVTVSSDQSGSQIFDLCDNGGAVLQTWTGNATSHVFSGLADGTYKGQVTYGGCVSVLSGSTTLTNTLQAVASILATPLCGSGTITISSNQSGTQTFDLCNDLGGVLQTWTGSATSRNFTSLASGTYYGRVTLGSCASLLTSGATLTNNSVPTAYVVSGVCSGGSGMTIGLSNSAIGINYQLRIDGVNTGSPIAGTGAPISFGNQIAAGTYTVRATNTTTLCENNMSGSIIVTASSCVNTWTGTTSTDWSIPTNWSTGAVPTNEDVVITGLPGNQPQITALSSCHNLTINPGASLTINNGQSLAVGGNFLIQSDASGTGSFIDIGTLTVTGTTTVQKYLTDHHWWYLGSPLSNGTGAAFNTLSATANSGNRLFYWNEVGHVYANVTNTTDAMPVLRGYSFKSFDATPLTASFTGTLNTGTIGSTSNLTYTTGTSQGFNLVCNPYPSAINWGSGNTPTTGLTQTSIGTTIWYRMNSTFATYNWSGSGVGANGGQQYIPAMQAFWVRTNGVAGTLQMTNAIRVHNAQSFYKTTETNVFRLEVADSLNNDETVVTFNQDAQNIFEDFDSEKMFATDADIPQLYTLTSDNTEVAINGQQELIPAEERIISLGFKTPVSGTFSLNATNLNDFDQNISVYLEDVQQNVIQDLRQAPVYNFSSGIIEDASRFRLHFGNLVTGISSVTEDQATAYSFANSVYVNIPNSNRGLVELYDVLGNLIYTQNVEKGLNKLNVVLTQGIYISVVKIGKKDFTQKIIILKQ